MPGGTTTRERHDERSAASISPQDIGPLRYASAGVGKHSNKAENRMNDDLDIKERELRRLLLMLEHVIHQPRFCLTIGQPRYTLTIRQLSILLSCYMRCGNRTLRELAANLGSNKPAVGRMVDHLIEQGLIERRSDPRDRRSVLFIHTAAGARLLHGIAAVGIESSAAPHDSITTKRID